MRKGGATESIGHETDSGGKAGETFFDVLGYNPGMSERDEKRGGLGCVIGLVLGVLFLPVLYFLSIGPAAWLIKSNDFFRWIGVIYYPMELLGEVCGPFDAGIRWYIDLWT